MKIGRLPDNVWKRSVRKSVKNNLFNEHTSDVIMNDGMDCIITRDRVVMGSPSMGSIAVYDALNTIYAYTSDVKGVSLHLYLDGRTSEEYMRHIAGDADRAAQSARAGIMEFETHIIQGLKKPFIEAKAIGNKQQRSIGNRANANQDIVITGYLALSGTIMMLEISRDKLRAKFSERFCSKADDMRKLLGAFDHPAIGLDNGATYIRSLSEGGIYSGLWDMTQNYNLGLIVGLKNLPFRQETIEIANELNLNPYEMSSIGSYIMTSDSGEELVNAFLDKGIPACKVGRTNNSNDKLIINEDEQRYLTVPSSDSIYEIM